MNVVRNENLFYWDVDSTLVFDCDANHPEAFKTSYYGQTKWVRPHKEHISLLKSHKARGFFVQVHTGNGYAWGEEIIAKLGLAEYVDDVRTKPRGHVDDKPKSSWMGEHVYLPEGE